jgi:hypothetical protein
MNSVESKQRREQLASIQNLITPEPLKVNPANRKDKEKGRGALLSCSLCNDGSTGLKRRISKKAVNFHTDRFFP